MKHSRSNSRFVSAFEVLLLVAAFSSAFAQSRLGFSEQEVLPSDGAANDNFGSATAVLGATAVIGAQGENDSQGAAYVFSEMSGSWIQSQKLVASDGAAEDLFGASSALQGNILIVGAPQKSFNSVFGGVAYVFTKTEGEWTQRQRLAASEGVFGGYFGGALAVSGDMIVIGAPNVTAGGSIGGSAYVFTLAHGHWTQAQELVASDSAAGNDFGWSVAFDGSTILVGAFGTQNLEGAVYVFTNAGGVWTQSQKLVGNDSVANDHFGYSVALSDNVAVIGALNATVTQSLQGAAYVFDGSGGVFAQTQKLVASDAVYLGSFGSAVATRGHRALIGAYLGGNDNQGEAYLFEERDGSWHQSNIFAPTSDGVGFGLTVGLDSSDILVGAEFSNPDSVHQEGAAYFFTPQAANVIHPW